MNKKLELLAEYLSDLSKIWFGGAILKQFIEHKFNLDEFVISILVSVIFLVFAYIIQPKGGDF